MSSRPISKTVNSDPILLLLGLNMVLVIVGYALAVLTGKASVEPMLLLKYAVLLLSILYFFRTKRIILTLLMGYLQPLFLLSAAFVVFALLSTDPVASIIRVLTYIVPFLYVAFSVGYLLLCYPTLSVLHAFIGAINWVYFIPIISFFLTGGKLSDTNIYFITSENEESAFVSNHYGWSGTLFLLTGIDLLRNVPLPWWRKTLILIFGVLGAYLVLISGNRTSWLSLILVALVFIFKYKRLRFYQKALISLLPLALIVYLIQDPKSAINVRAEKSQTQQAKGESRFNRAQLMVSYFNQSPDLWVTGIGMFNKDKIKSITSWPGYHNSYFDVLFGSGIMVFAIFLYFIVLRPVWNYLRYYATYYLFFIPLLVIPYFESNLTGGQFLFFPWFTAALFMGYSPHFAKIKVGLNSIKP